MVAQIKKKHRKRRGEQAYKEKQLQESLQSGEVQVEARYAADCRELGEYVKRGDGEPLPNPFPIHSEVRLANLRSHCP